MTATIKLFEWNGDELDTRTLRFWSEMDAIGFASDLCDELRCCGTVTISGEMLWSR